MSTIIEKIMNVLAIYWNELLQLKEGNIIKTNLLKQGVNKRFQRLESHVVTLARSVAHLSSEMRTQHIMIQEMETIRNEIAQLRSHPLRMSSAGPSGVYGKTSRYQHRLDRDSCWQGAVPALTDPGRVKKLTSFFGDEPPLLRIFLKKLGYEVIDLNFSVLVFQFSA